MLKTIIMLIFVKGSLEFENNLNLSYLLKDYFSLKNIYSLKINHCYNTKEVKLIYDHFKESGFKINCANVDWKNWLYKGMSRGDYNKIGVYLDFDCLNERAETIIEGVEKYTAANYNWLIKTRNYSRALTFLNILSLRWDSEFSLLTSDGNIYRLHKDNTLKSLSVKNVAVWNNHLLKNLGPIEMGDLNGLILKGFISLYANPDEVDALNYLKLKTADPRDNLIKFSFAIHVILMKKYNARLKLLLGNNTETGKIYEFINGSLGYYSGGQFYALEKGDVDIGLFLAEPLSAGLSKISILPGITTFRQYFIFKHPRRFTKPGDILTPFSSYVWYTFIVISVLCIVILRLTSYTFVNDDDNNEPSTVLQIILVVGSLAQQGLTVTSSRISQRIIHFTLLILSTLTYGFYNASLLILLLSPPPKYLNSVDKLINSDLKLVAEDVPFYKFQLSTNYSGILGRLHSRRQCVDFTRPELFYSLMDGVKLLQENSFAFFSHESNVYSTIETQFTKQFRCNLAEVPVFQPLVVSSFVRKRFLYKELFTRGILLLKEVGIVSRENRYWMRKKLPCLHQDRYFVADLKSAYFAYIIYFCGLLSSITLLGFEHFYAYTFINTTINKK